MPEIKHDVETIVHQIIDEFTKGATRDEWLQKLLSMGICEEDSNYILDMIELAYSRAYMAKMGMSLADMSSNVDDDKFFRAALKVYLQLFGIAGQPQHLSCGSMVIMLLSIFAGVGSGLYLGLIIPPYFGFEASEVTGVAGVLIGAALAVLACYVITKRGK